MLCGYLSGCFSCSLKSVFLSSLPYRVQPCCISHNCGQNWESCGAVFKSYCTVVYLVLLYTVCIQFTTYTSAKEDFKITTTTVSKNQLLAVTHYFQHVFQSTEITALSAGRVQEEQQQSRSLNTVSDSLYPLYSLFLSAKPLRNERSPQASLKKNINQTTKQRKNV